MKKHLHPAQKQSLPGVEDEMKPPPKDEDEDYKGSEKLLGKVAIITGSDSGIGKAIAIAFAKEGADIVSTYLCEYKDAARTQKRVHEIGKECILIPGDISDSQHCKYIIKKTIEEFGKIDILVNHVGEQYQLNDFTKITDNQINRIFSVNVYSMFYMTREVLKHMKKEGVIINTASVVAYKGNPLLIDYTATKAAVVGFTRALASSLIEKKIRVNAVAPGPIWTPLIPASFSAEIVEDFGKDDPMGREGQPYEVAPAYVYLACNRDSSYVTGQVLHVNGGTIVNG